MPNSMCGIGKSFGANGVIERDMLPGNAFRLFGVGDFGAGRQALRRRG